MFRNFSQFQIFIKIISNIAYASVNGGYDYGSYYPPMNAGMNNSMGDNGIGQTSDNSSGNQTDYEHDNLYGKAKTSIVSSPTYHPYARS